MRKAFEVGPSNNRFRSWDLAAFRGDFSSRVRSRQKHFRLLIYALDNNFTDLHTSDEALSLYLYFLIQKGRTIDPDGLNIREETF